MSTTSPLLTQMLADARLAHGDEDGRCGGPRRRPRARRRTLRRHVGLAVARAGLRLAGERAAGPLGLAG